MGSGVSAENVVAGVKGGLRALVVVEDGGWSCGGAILFARNGEVEVDFDAPRTVRPS